LKTLADKLGGAVPKSFAELVARVGILVATTSYQEFDAAVRESYITPDKFKDAFAAYDKARKLRDRAFEISQARDYLAAACDVDKGIELDRKTNLGFFKFDTLFASPHLVPARLDSFEKWKGNYVQAYRKAHRAFFENLEKIAASAQALRPRVIALDRLNKIIELGPPLTGTGNLASKLDQLESAAWICPDAAEAEVAGTNAVCPKCDWTPVKALPQKDCDHLSSLIGQGLADRIQRLKDASIAAILKKAADESHRADLNSLLEIIQIADADKLVGVITDDLVTFLRKLLQEANIVHETVALQPILNQIGAVEEERIEESLSKLTSLLRTAIREAAQSSRPEPPQTGSAYLSYERSRTQPTPPPARCPAQRQVYRGSIGPSAPPRPDLGCDFPRWQRASVLEKHRADRPASGQIYSSRAGASVPARTR
jgi:hypothetical protein